MLRGKVVFGGILVKRRPPHPLDEKTSRAKRRSNPARRDEERLEENPHANLARLKKAREDADETRDLLPNPHDNPDWVSRFSSLSQSELSLVSTEQPPLPETIRDNTKDEPPQRPSSNGPRRRPLKHSLDQMKMF